MFQPTKLYDGVAIDLDHGSIMIECAKEEWHATSAVVNPDEKNPSRVSLVFYQHRGLDQPDHGRESLKAASAALQARRHQEIIDGQFRPTIHQLKRVGAAGFQLPPEVDVVIDGHLGQVVRL